MLMSTWGGLRLDGLALGRRRVAVIDGRGEKREGEGGVQLLEGLELVLLQRLQGKQIQGVALGFGQERLQDRQIINQGLAAGRGGGHQQVLPRPDVRQRLPLVGVESRGIPRRPAPPAPAATAPWSPTAYSTGFSGR